MLNCYKDFFIRNGELLPCSGFNTQLFCEGKSIYEVCRVIDGIPLFCDEHIDRLYTSAKMTGVEIRYSREEIIKTIGRLIRANKVEIGNVEIIFNFDDHDGSNCRIFLALCIENRYPSPKQYEQGMPSLLMHAERANPNAKQVLLELREKTVEIIREAGIYDVMLVDRNNMITEGSRSNIFFIQNEKIFTPPMHQVLRGITREKIFHICKSAEISIVEKTIYTEDLNRFQSAFFSGTSPKILPVSAVGEVMYDPQDPLLRYLMKAYNEMIEQNIEKYRNIFSKH
ncbi:MAG: aminotransferase class IV [Bacteroidales bacterium]|nr:aminotransferase class IV [Bacteroidales bacterium]MCF8345295.1 aminotransferase class IV [Bacteroidales bacterium]MCF8352660.1 aminotransferase class IV [Bacteroidales bacterium]MCF8377859.1 aminotransferase class IV [Bacteroidales bacterium]